MVDFTRLFEILEYQQVRFPQTISMAGRKDGAWRTWQTTELLTERDRLSAGMLAAGLHKGDHIGILAHCGSPQWAIADAAMLQIGIIPVPIHATARPDEIAHIAKDARLRAAFVSNMDMYAKIKSAGVQLEFVIAFETTPDTTDWNTIVCEPGAVALEKIKYLRDGIGAHDLATLLYTSGTTGIPKGVMLTHANIVTNVKAVLAIVPVGPHTTTVSFLPLSHILERMVVYAYQAAGVPVWYADAVENLPEIFLEVRPHFFSAVPRILERMYERLLDERNKAGTLQRKVIDWAIALGERFPYSGEYNMPFVYRIKRFVADFLVFRHWRKRMGGRVQSIAVGAAAMQPRLGRLFSAAGIDVREGYGLTETSPVIAFNRFEPGGVHFGTVGIPAPGVEVRLADMDAEGQGEIEVRGPNVMAGYWGLPEETAARFTPDGWFKTGDLGRFEYKRFLKITGRKSEIFKTTTGKFVAPAFVEQQLATSPFISQAMVVGANEPFVGALIVPNFAYLESWCREHNVHWTAPQFIVLNPKIEKLYRQQIEFVNTERLGTIEKIREFCLLHHAWSPENGLLTPTLKLRRDVIARQFSEEIAGLFTD